MRRFTPTECDSTSEELRRPKKTSLLFWRNFGGGGGVPNQVDRPRMSFSLQQNNNVTLRSSSTFGDSDNIDESIVRQVSCLSYSQAHALKRTIDHPAWKNCTLGFILIILFGPAIRDIWLPMSADVAVDVLLTMAFAFLAVDIIIRCIVDQDYFEWTIKSRDSLEKKYRVGSFMFWIDTVSDTFPFESFFMHTFLPGCRIVFHE